MQKNISTILARGNLTPRERFLLLIQNDVRAHREGKEALTPADKAALENWHAKDNAEAHEWNRLNDGWKYAGRMGLEAEFHFHDAQASHLQVRPIIMELIKYTLHRDIHLMIESVKGVKKVTAAEAMEIVSKQRTVKMQDGLDFEYAVYQLAFERLDKEDRDQFLELYADIETDHQYLDQEEVIAHLLGDKEELGDEAKEKLAELIAAQSYNAFAKEHQLYHYFACIPLAEVARHFLEMKGIPIEGKKLAQNQEADDEDDYTHSKIQKAVEQYAKDHGTTVEAILKEGLVHWYDTEGFVYTPLVLSDSKELFLRWLKAKTEARKELKGWIDSGLLKVRERTPEETHKEKLYSRNLYDGELAEAKLALEVFDLPHPKTELEEKKAFEKFSDTVITGEGLYNFASDLEWVKDFKERVDQYDPNLGLVYADDDPEHDGEHLDQELLICRTFESGELEIFSRFGMSTKRLEMLLESIIFFEDKKIEGKIYLKFKNEELEKMFRESRESFIAAYQKLLAHREIMQKLSAIYETDLAFRVEGLLAHLDGYIEAHNEALHTAERPAQYKNPVMNVDKIVAVVDKELFIEKSTLAADQSVIDEHTTKLKAILGSFS